MCPPASPVADHTDCVARGLSRVAAQLDATLHARPSSKPLRCTPSRSWRASWWSWERRRHWLLAVYARSTTSYDTRPSWARWPGVLQHALRSHLWRRWPVAAPSSLRATTSWRADGIVGPLSFSHGCRHADKAVPLSKTVAVAVAVATRPRPRRGPRSRPRSCFGGTLSNALH